LSLGGSLLHSSNLLSEVAWQATSRDVLCFVEIWGFANCGLAHLRIVDLLFAFPPLALSKIVQINEFLAT